MNRLMLLVLAVSAFCATVYGADTSVKERAVKVGDATYYLHAGNDDKCQTATFRDGSIDVTCQDGKNMAVVNSIRGCMESSGDGYCGKNVHYQTYLSGSQLNCPNGKSYSITSGVLGDNECVQHGDLKVCQTSDGKLFGSASCKNGCDNTRGGGCCMLGVQGCMVGIILPPELAREPKKP